MLRRPLHTQSAALFLLVLALIAQPAVAQQDDSAPAVQDSQAAPEQSEAPAQAPRDIEIFDALKKSGALDKAARFDQSVERVLSLYRKRDHKPIWIDNVRRFAELRSFINRLADEGMHPEHYDVSAFNLKQGTQEERYLTDFQISAAYLSLVRDTDEGRYNHRYVHSLVDTASQGLEAENLFVWFKQLLPQNEIYANLKEALQFYKHIEMAGDFPLIDSSEVLHPGMIHPQIPILRSYLRMSGDLPSTKQSDQQQEITLEQAQALLNSDTHSVSAQEYSASKAPALGSDLQLESQAQIYHLDANDDITTHLSAKNSLLYDDELLEAVKHFQARFNLNPDGIIGANTFYQLNTSASFRILTIKANLERLRWEFEPDNDRYVRVNLPDYTLKAYDKGELVLEMPVIVGKTGRPTPVLADHIVNLKFRPDWNVPPTIFAQDYFPNLVENPAYAENKGFEMYYDGQRITPREAARRGVLHLVRLRQPPSDQGALGAVRFSLTNELSIFLHDTPTKGLFANDSRAFSSGCVRVGSPQQLAEYVLDDPLLYPSERVRALMDQGETTFIPIDQSKRPAVYLSYITTKVQQDGSIHFLEDFYGYDNDLMPYFF